MKKVTLILTFIAMSIMTMKAQTLSAFGIKAARNSSTQRIDESLIPESSKTLYRDGSLKTWNIGAYANFSLTRKWGLTTELQYNSIKGGVSQNGNAFKEHFIAMPILLTRKFGFLRLEGGTELSYLQKAELQVPNFGEVKQSMSNKFDYAGVIGARFDFGIANIGVRYIKNFADQGGICFGNPETCVPFKNSTYQVLVGIPLYKR
jgi:Outer membrane protein beta-barrel domain